MKLTIKYLLFLFCSLISFFSYPHAYLWVSTAPNPIEVNPIENVEVGYLNQTIVGKFVLKEVNGGGRVLRRQCVRANREMEPASKAVMVALPQRIGPFKLNGIDGWSVGQKGVVDSRDGVKYDVYYRREDSSYSVEQGCKGEHFFYNNVGFIGGSGNFQGELVDHNLLPGRYTYNYFLIHTLYENKHSETDSIPNDWFAAAVNNGNHTPAKLEIVVKSDCTISPDQVNLSHGDVTPKQAVNHQTPPVRISVNCKGPVNMDFSVLGSEPVSGQTNNFTDCDIGSCEITYTVNGEIGTKEFESSIHNTNSADVFVSSTLHPDLNRMKAGTFTGSGVLKITIH